MSDEEEASLSKCKELLVKSVHRNKSLIPYHVKPSDPFMEVIIIPSTTAHGLKVASTEEVKKIRQPKKTKRGSRSRVNANNNLAETVEEENQVYVNFVPNYQFNSTEDTRRSRGKFIYGKIEVLAIVNEMEYSLHKENLTIALPDSTNDAEYRNNIRGSEKKEIEFEFDLPRECRRIYLRYIECGDYISFYRSNNRKAILDPKLLVPEEVLHYYLFLNAERHKFEIQFAAKLRNSLPEQPIMLKHQKLHENSIIPSQTTPTTFNLNGQFQMNNNSNVHNFSQENRNQYNNYVNNNNNNNSPDHFGNEIPNGILPFGDAGGSIVNNIDNYSLVFLNQSTMVPQTQVQNQNQNQDTQPQPFNYNPQIFNNNNYNAFNSYNHQQCDPNYNHQYEYNYMYGDSEYANITMHQQTYHSLFTDAVLDRETVLQKLSDGEQSEDESSFRGSSPSLNYPFKL